MLLKCKILTCAIQQRCTALTKPFADLCTQTRFKIQIITTFYQLFDVNTKI